MNRHFIELLKRANFKINCDYIVTQNEENGEER